MEQKNSEKTKGLQGKAQDGLSEKEISKVPGMDS